MSETQFQPTREMAKAQANELVAVLASKTIDVDDQVRVGNAIAFLLACQSALPTGEPQPWIGGIG